jgi:hypothetical protein
MYLHRFLDRISTIFRHDYMPTDEDIIFSAHKETSTLTQRTIARDSKRFKIYNSPSLASEDLKWIKYCERHIDVIAFVVSLDFHQYAPGGEFENQFVASLVLFEELVNCESFSDCRVAILFTKDDLLDSYLQKARFIDCLPYYKRILDDKHRR